MRLISWCPRRISHIVFWTLCVFVEFTESWLCNGFLRKPVHVLTTYSSPPVRLLYHFRFRWPTFDVFLCSSIYLRGASTFSRERFHSCLYCPIAIAICMFRFRLYVISIIFRVWTEVIPLLCQRGRKFKITLRNAAHVVNTNNAIQQW